MRRRTLSLAFSPLPSLLLTGVLLAQAPAAPAPAATPKFKGKAPVNTEVLKIKLPRAQENTCRTAHG